MNDYTFPKGHVENDESLEEAAIRETFEETGYKIKVKGFIDSFEYKVKEKKGGENIYVIRRVYNYWGEVISGEADGKNIDVNEGGMEVMWLSYEDALKQLTYDNNKQFLIKLYNKILQM